MINKWHIKNSSMVNDITKKTKKKYKEYIFYLGIFLLPSAFTISAILLLIASIFGVIETKENFLKDKFNRAFLISGFLMIISCIIQTLTFKNQQFLSWSPALSWIGLANWIPFFIISFGFQPFLVTNFQRKKFALMLLTGSVPVFLSGFAQVFFNLHGPIEGLNGLIIWYLRPLGHDEITGIGLTGLFNNANYAGAWLSIVWPISLAFFFERESTIKKIISFLFVILTSSCIFLTTSRAALIGLSVGTIMFLNSKHLKWILLFFISVFFLMLFFIWNDIPILLSTDFLNEFKNYQYLDRLDMWIKSPEIISSNPFFGTGASSFSDQYKNITGLYKNHSHNIILELMLSYGIPAALFTTIPIFYLLMKSAKKLFEVKNIKSFIFDKSLIISLIIIIMIQMVDIQYFDGRISIAIWVLIAAIKNIVFQNTSLKDLERIN